MVYIRKENQTPDASIPYDDYNNAVLYIHGSTSNREWRTKLIQSLTDYHVLLLDPWKNSWSSYVEGLENEKKEYLDLIDQAIVSGSDGGSGVVDGYTPITIPDIDNFPFFWENRALENSDYQLFVFDSNEEIANHVVIQLISAIKKDKNKVVVMIANEDWRIQYSVFLKDFTRENYFGNVDNAINRLKIIMGV